MSFLKAFWWVPCLLLAFLFILMLGAHLQVKAKKPPDWSPAGDPLDSLSQHDAMVCWPSNDSMPGQVKLLVRWMPGAGGDHVSLYPSQRGECGVLPLLMLDLNPVMVQVSQLSNQEHHHSLVTTWSPTHKPEPDPPYSWSTTEMSEDSGSWWMTFTFSSSNRSRPVVEIRVEWT